MSIISWLLTEAGRKCDFYGGFSIRSQSSGISAIIALIININFFGKEENEEDKSFGSYCVYDGIGSYCVYDGSGEFCFDLPYTRN